MSSDIIPAKAEVVTTIGVCWYYIACSPEKGMVPGVERLPCIGVGGLQGCIQVFGVFRPKQVVSAGAQTDPRA